jgi:hypothetical protein
MNSTENRLYLYELTGLNEKKKGQVDKAFTDLIGKVIWMIAVGLSDELSQKISELEVKANQEGMKRLNRDWG